MSNDRTARVRLDALLTELEEEILETEDSVATDVVAMRSLVDSAIGNDMRAETDRSASPGRMTFVKGKVASTVELLGRLTGVGQGTIRPSAPRVRMAFSGKSDKPQRERRRVERPSRDVKERNDQDD